ncbi:hypothetical protein O6H91_07G069100 [Diphasiastrum complanatum]|uniref:Uncharacterized protein n=1 Tax=Diphasiastrum complanatum TaxID=34168 RepID=A0ACC2D6D6_DIPCM|nr:hypothetical protein O6H91_07G069100 [Diphasiastrum complanatum]
MAYSFCFSRCVNSSRLLLIVLLASCLLLQLHVAVSIALSQQSEPLSCLDVGRICKAYMHYMLPPNTSLQYVQDLFNVRSSDIFAESNSTLTDTGPNYQQSLFVKVKCSCSPSTKQYFANAQINLTTNGTASKSIHEKYEGLAWVANNTANSSTSTGAISIPLLCGCSSTDWDYLLSYVVAKEDTLTLLAERFNSSISAIKTTNNISSNHIYNGMVYYIPINNVSGQSDQVGSLQADTEGTTQGEHHHRLSVWAEVGILVLCFAVIILLTALCVRAKVHTTHPNAASKRESGVTVGSSCTISILGSFSSCVGRPDSSGTLSNLKREQQGNFTKGLAVDMMIEKPMVFSWNEVAIATENFKETNLLGQGAYGSVFFGKLRNQEVAVKSMKANKSDEFLAELKVLCRVHHTNLVELIGYSISEEDLFLVYEYAENRALSDRLHDPVSKGFPPLSWNQRVHIALDSAQGLEYIHLHTKEHYVHRDVKTSNILLDSSLRGKVADFGLAKLVLQTGETAVTRVVGTFGYLAPEYLRESQATAKSDVYSFGVVLFELITGLEAVSTSRIASARSIVSIVLAALRKSNPLDSSALEEIMDPNLCGMYPISCVYEMAILAKQCVEHDPNLRPDMANVVFALSNIVSSSTQWETSLAEESMRPSPSKEEFNWLSQYLLAEQ